LPVDLHRGDRSGNDEYGCQAQNPQPKRWQTQAKLAGQGCLCSDRLWIPRRWRPRSHSRLWLQGSLHVRRQRCPVEVSVTHWTDVGLLIDPGAARRTPPLLPPPLDLKRVLGASELRSQDSKRVSASLCARCPARGTDRLLADRTDFGRLRERGPTVRARTLPAVLGREHRGRRRPALWCGQCLTTHKTCARRSTDLGATVWAMALTAKGIPRICQ
jgi:hypothetical protein